MGKQLTFFKDSLPKRVFATNDFQQGSYLIPKAQAIKSRYIQHNGPTHKRWLVFDIDRPGGGHDWRELQVPGPNIVVENKKNRHAHLIYGLEIPVRVNADNARIKPIRYAAAIENGLMKKLEGDPGYANFICKNPLSDYWVVNTYQEYMYSLEELADYVDLEPYQDRRKHLPDYGLGRNCTLFENLRTWAYRTRRKDWDMSISYWYEITFRQAEVYNSRFNPSLPFVEVKATAKSVSKWVWNNFTRQEFSQIQRARAEKLAVRRRKEAAERAQMVLWYAQANPGIKQREIAKEFNITNRTVRAYLKKRK